MLIGRLEDRRQARRALFVRLLFVLGLAAWFVLALWWAVYFYRTTVQVRDVTLRAYAAEAQLQAFDLERLQLSQEDAAKELAGTIFTVKPGPIHAGPFPSVRIEAGPLKGDAVVVRAEERERLQASLHRKFIMLAGEGSLLIGFLFACLIGLYRLFAEEVQLRRQQESFVHSVTHELKSPLAGLRALLQSFETLELSREERRLYLKMGMGEIDRLDQQVANILLSSRLEAEVFQPRLTRVDLAETLERLRERKQIQFQEKGGSLTIEARSAQATMDPEALDTILENLVDNALKYGGEHPRVIVSARVDGRRARVDVTDSGTGLTRDELERVFMKFYRSPSGEAQQAKGSGLGLFIARGLARACGGDIRVASPGSGKGCTFTVELPLVRGAMDAGK